MADFRRFRLVVGIALACLTMAGCDAFVSTEQRIERAELHLSKGNYGAARRELVKVLREAPDNARARLAFARLSLDTGDVQTADRDLRQAIVGHADAAESAKLRYEILIASGRYAEAAADLDQEKALDPVERQIQLIAAHTGLSQFTEAEAAAEEALRLAPNDARVHYARAKMQVAQHQAGAAHQSLDAAIAADPAFAQAWMLKGMVFAGQSQLKEARDALMKADELRARLRPPEHMSLLAALAEIQITLNDLESAGATVRRLSKLAPQSLPAWYLQGRLAFAKSDFRTAVSDLQRAVKISEDHLPSRLLLAAALLATGSLEQSHATLSRILAEVPGHPEASKLLAQVELARGDAKAAVNALSGGTGAEDAQSALLRGVALLRSGDVDGGISALEQSVALNPNDVQARASLADAYMAAGAIDKALSVIDSLPADPSRNIQRAMLRVASVVTKDRAGAQPAIEKLVEESPRDAALLTAAGVYLAGSGNLIRAAQLLESAIKIDPALNPARLALASIERNRQRLDAAQRLLEEALRREPRNQQALLSLAQIAYERGDRAAARQRLESAVSADPSAVEARLRLAQLAFAESDVPRGEALLKQAVDASRQNPRVVRAAGRVLLAAGRKDAAAAQFTAALQSGLPEAGLEAADVYVELDRPADARRVLEKALSLRPGWPRAEMGLAELDVRQGNTAAAYRRIEALRKANLPAATVDQMAGDLRMMAQDFNQAVAFYDKALASAPSSQLVIKKYRARAATNGSGKEGILLEWLADHPEDTTVRRLLASVYQQRGETELAIPQYERLVRDAAGDAESLNNLAWLYHETGDARALETARLAYEGAPRRAEIADTYGWILVETGRVAEGRDILERAASMSRDPEIQYHLAVAHVKSGARQAAADILRQLVESGTPFPSRPRAVELLKEVTG